MSLYNLARHVQSRGRGDDTMLVHMTPGEVQGLQALAMKHGGSLSINPETGFPEAGFLENILPAVTGAIGSYFGVNPLTTALISGGVNYATTGNLNKGLMAGLGAWGGASLMSNIMGAGTPSVVAGMLGTDAATAPGSQADMLAKMSGDMLDPKNIQSSASYASGFDPKKVTPVSDWDKLKSGFEATKFDTNWLKQNAFPLAATAAPLLMSDTSRPSAPPPVNTGQIRPYTYGQTRNPNYGMPGEPYFTQTYTAGTPYTAKEGGIVALAEGGQYSGPVERMSALEQEKGMYPQGMMDKTYYSTPSQRPASMEVIKSDYDTPVSAVTGIGPQFADGGIVALADGGQPPDPIPPTIPTATGVDMLQLAPNLQQYGRPAPAMDPSVAAYNQILAQRAANEYVTQPAPLTMLPGGGERASAADTQKIINEYYLKNLGRQGEQTGLDFWTQRKMDTGMSLADINKAIAESPEAVARRAAQASTSASTTAKTAGIGDYIYDQATGKFTKITPSITDGGITELDINDPGFQNYLRQQYAQYEASQSGGGSGGGKAGGLMPKALKYASGGISHLGDYSDGGRLLKGPGDGVSDSIPAQIGDRQPARLADGEFVVPARIVSELGNGSTDAGARKLYAMMDRVQKKRRKSIGKDKVAVDTKSENVLPV